MKTDWKSMSKKVSEIHSQEGRAAVDKTGRDAMELPYPLINTIPEDKLMSLAGKNISPKAIRKFTWENRKERFITRDKTVIWTYYDLDSDTSYVGAGAFVEPKALNKVKEENVLRSYESENPDVTV